MKKQFVIASLSLLFIGCAAFFMLHHSVPGEFMLDKKGEENEAGLNKAQRIKEAMEARFNKLKDENGNYYSSYYADAVKYANQRAQSGSRAGSLNLQWEELGPDNVGGRTRAILVDKRDASGNTVYAGGVSGGMWKSTDGANTWSLLSNWNQWLAVSCITQGPDNIIYIGTGEGLAQIGGSSFNSGSMGNGIFKLDANDTPVQITPDGFTSNALNQSDVWAAVNRIAVNPNDANFIIAATGKGLYQSSDHGVNWSPITITGVSNGQSAADVKWASDGINIWASVGGNNKVVRSPNGGFSWDRISANALNPGFPSTQGRIEIALAPADPNYVYLSIATSGGSTYGVYRTTNGTSDTVRWASIGNKGPLFDPFGGNNQGWYDNTIAVSPSNPNRVYVGGVDFYTWSDLSGWKLDDAGLGGGNANPYYIHPDKHTIVFGNTPDIMYVGCDGGVFKSVNASSSFPYPSFTVKNRGYNVTQNYSVAAGFTGGVLGGSQDNGTNYINYLGNTFMSGDAVTGGDGTYAEISHIDPRIMFSGIYFGSNYRSGNGGSSFDGFYDIKVDPQGHTQPSRCGGQKDANAQFISPFWLGETKNAANGFIKVPFVANRNYNAGEVLSLESKTAKYPFQHTLTGSLSEGDTLQVNDPIRSRFFLHSFCGVWVTSDALELGGIPRWFKLMNSMTGTAQSLSCSADGDMLYVGTNSGRVYRFPNLDSICDNAIYPVGANAVGVLYGSGQFTFTTPASGRSIEGISVDPYNNDHVVAVVSGFSSTNLPHVYESINGGQTWTPLTNGLPNMPVYDVVVHDANTIIIGSELGVWSWDGSTWNEENDAFTQPGSVGLARVPVYRLIEKSLYDDNCKVLYIGTHGRGMWRSTTLTTGGCNLNVTGLNDVKKTQLSNLNIFPNPVNSSSRISLTMDKSADVIFRVFDMSGKLYKEVTYRNTTVGENQFNLDASGLSNGTYVLAATVGTSRTQSRLFTVTR